MPTIKSGLVARPRDLAGEGPAQILDLSNGGALLRPGRWEVALAPHPAAYVIGFYWGGMGIVPSGRFDGWNEFTVNGRADGVTFVLSPKPSGVASMPSPSSRPTRLPIPGREVMLGWLMTWSSAASPTEKPLTIQSM